MPLTVESLVKQQQLVDEPVFTDDRRGRYQRSTVGVSQALVLQSLLQGVSWWYIGRLSGRGPFECVVRSDVLRCVFVVLALLAELCPHYIQRLQHMAACILVDIYAECWRCSDVCLG